VKITKGNIDPQSEPDSNYGSFLYNSKWMKDLKVESIENPPKPTVTGYYPSGSTVSNYQYAYWEGELGGFYTHYLFVRGSYYNPLYDLPAFDVKVKRDSDGHFIEQYRWYSQGSTDSSGRNTGYRVMATYGEWYEDRAYARGSSSNQFALNDYFGHLGNCADIRGAFVPSTPYVIIWRLPGNEEAIRDAEPHAPVPGQKVIEINNDFCRVAKPGFDVGTATPTQLAFDSSSRPANIIKADDIELPSGQSFYELGFQATENTVCDMILYTGSIITFPMGAYYDDKVCEYWFSGSRIYFLNSSGSATRCRFMVYAFDAQPQSSGNNKVWRQFTANGENVSQFLKPGAADPPRPNDIILDSRWPALQILAEGYQSIANKGNYFPPSVNPGDTFSVPFESNGLLPFVKFWMKFYDAEYGYFIRPARTAMTENFNNVTRYHTRGSAYCELSGSAAVFHTFMGNPDGEVWNSNQGWRYTYDLQLLVGIRYYILGLAI
jgi:hypothetical protein